MLHFLLLISYLVSSSIQGHGHQDKPDHSRYYTNGQCNPYRKLVRGGHWTLVLEATNRDKKRRRKKQKEEEEERRSRDVEDMHQSNNIYHIPYT